MARWMTTSIARMSTGYGHGYGSDTDSVDSLDEVKSMDDVDDMDESSDMPSAGSSQNTWAYEPEDRGAMVANVTRPQKDQLPNPDKDRHALLLGSFSLPVKARRGMTIEDIKKRLWPNGAYERDYWQPPCHEITLNELFKVEHVERWNRRIEDTVDMFSPRFLYFDIPQPQAAAEEEVPPVSVLVLHSGVQMTRSLVKLPASCTAAAARAAISHQLTSQMYPSAALHLVHLHNKKTPDTMRFELLPDEHVVTAGDYQKQEEEEEEDDAGPELMVLWLPEDGMAPAEGCWRHVKVSSSGQYVLLVHLVTGTINKEQGAALQLLPLPEGAGQAAASTSAAAAAAGAGPSSSRGPAAGRPGSSSSSSSSSWQRELQGHSKEAWGHHIYDYGMANDLNTACDAPGGLRFQPLPLSPSSAGPKGAKKAKGKGKGPGGTPAEAAPEGLVWLVPGAVALMSTSWKSPQARLNHMSARTIYNSRQTYLRGLQRALTDKASRAAWRQKRRHRSQQYLLHVVDELKRYGRAVPFAGGTKGELAVKPSVAVRVELACPDPAEPRNGTATFTVWTWPSAGVKHASLFTAQGSLDGVQDDGSMIFWHDDVSDSGSEDEAEQEEEQQQEEEGAHPNEVPRPAPVKWARAHLSTSVRSGPPLVCTLRAMYGEDPQVGAFYDAWMESAWRWKSCKRGITGLLDVVTSGPGPCVQQPPGLTVPLRLHQQQSLHRLLEAERLPLGYNSWLWCRVPTPGEPVWLSLVLGKMSREAPSKAPCGGFLAEEMGLGKTIEVLALILANPAPDTAPPPPPPPQPAAPTASPKIKLKIKGKGKGSAGAASSSSAAQPQLSSTAGEGEGGAGSSTAPVVLPGQEMPWTRRPGPPPAEASAGGGGNGEVGPGAGGLPPRPPPKKKQKKGNTKQDDPAAAVEAAEGVRYDWPLDELLERALREPSPTPIIAAVAAAPAAAGGSMTATAGTSGAGAAGASTGGAGDSPSATGGASSSTAAAAAAASTRTRQPQGLLYSRATLVVCAVSLVGQWIDEAVEKTGGSLRIFKYHGAGRSKADAVSLARDYDVVVTTYATLTADHSYGSPPLEKIHWWRVVFDEGHSLRNPKAAMTKIAAGLSADRRWVVTGTPIGGEATDLEGQFMALQLAPFDTPGFFRSRVKKPFHKYQAQSIWGQTGCCGPLPLVHTLRCCTTRHTKTQVLGGQAVLQLPPKTEGNIPVVLNAAEREAYLTSFEAARAIWQRLAGMGHQAVNRHVLQAMGLITPLRRICSGGRFTAAELAPKDIVVHHVPGRAGAVPLELADSGLAAPEDQECVVCLDEMENPVVTPCHHWFCRECITSCLQNKDTCPLCRQPIRANQLRAAAKPEAGPAEGGDPVAAEEEAAAEAPRCVLCDSKLKALLKALVEMFEGNPASKALVFSQYNSTLDWLQATLPSFGLSCRYINGSMTLNQRTKAIEAFQRDPPTTVFLLSMRSGAVGINLTAADHVFLLEPCLNPALEEQAVGRAWRLGQARPVTVKRLYVAGSVEERIVELAKQRRAGGGAGRSGSGVEHLFQEALAGGRDAAGAAVGRIQADTQRLRYDELEALFKPPELPPAAEDDAAEVEGLKARLAAILPPEALAAAQNAGGARRGRGRPPGSRNRSSMDGAGGAAAGGGRKKAPRRSAAAEAAGRIRAGYSQIGDGDEEKEDEEGGFGRRKRGRPSSSSGSPMTDLFGTAAAAAGRRPGQGSRGLPDLDLSSSGSSSDEEDEPPARRHRPLPAAAGGAAAAAAAGGVDPDEPVDEAEAIRRAAAAARASLAQQQAAAGAGAAGQPRGRQRGGRAPGVRLCAINGVMHAFPRGDDDSDSDGVMVVDPADGPRGMPGAGRGSSSRRGAAGLRGGGRGAGRQVMRPEVFQRGSSEDMDADLAAVLAASAAEAKARADQELQEMLAEIAAAEQRQQAAAALPEGQQ